ncbi:MAG: carbonic anhydrase [Phycisphaerae bacterium]
MDKILRGVEHFRRFVFPKQRELFAALSSSQQPAALFVTCSDSRIHPDLITQSSPGDLFILRNPGNLIPAYSPGPASTDATIEFAIDVLHIAHIIVCGHSDCGAMKALLNRDDTRHLPAVTAWLEHAESTLRVLAASVDSPADPLERLDKASRINVMLQLDNLRTHPSVAAALQRGELQLHAWHYDIPTGEVTEFDAATSQFVPVSAPRDAVERGTR